MSNVECVCVCQRAVHDGEGVPQVPTLGAQPVPTTTTVGQRERERISPQVLIVNSV